MAYKGNNPIPVHAGGTGIDPNSPASPDIPLCGPVDSSSPLQSIPTSVDNDTSDSLYSAGSSSLPIWRYKPGSLATITGNTGGTVSPTANNINLVGASGVTVTQDGVIPYQMNLSVSGVTSSTFTTSNGSQATLAGSVLQIRPFGGDYTQYFVEGLYTTASGNTVSIGFTNITTTQFGSGSSAPLSQFLGQGQIFSNAADGTLSFIVTINAYSPDLLAGATLTVISSVVTKGSKSTLMGSTFTINGDASLLTCTAQIVAPGTDDNIFLQFNGVDGAAVNCYAVADFIVAS